MNLASIDVFYKIIAHIIGKIFVFLLGL